MGFISDISIWQASLMTCTLIAIVIGRPRFVVVFVMGLNLFATHVLGNTYSTMMVIDLVCAAALMGRGVRADFVALLFSLMVPIYGLAIFSEWSPSTTYAIMEVLSYLQIAIIGGVGHGYIRRNFGADYRCDGSLHTLAERYHIAGIDKTHFGPQKVRGRDLD